jgi:hypothetical protein
VRAWVPQRLFVVQQGFLFWQNFVEIFKISHFSLRFKKNYISQIFRLKSCYALKLLQTTLKWSTISPILIKALNFFKFI